MPALDQGPTYRCGAYAPAEWFLAFGYDVRGTSQWDTAIQLADVQQGMSFEQERTTILAFADASGTSVQWLGDGYLEDFPTFEQAVKDGWCVVVGVHLPITGYMHFEAVDDIENGVASVKDSFGRYDGEPDHLSVAALEQEILRNWDANIAGLAWKIA